MAEDDLLCMLQTMRALCRENAANEAAYEPILELLERAEKYGGGAGVAAALGSMKARVVRLYRSRNVEPHREIISYLSGSLRELETAVRRSPTRT